jgi:hypothetical protein
MPLETASHTINLDEPGTSYQPAFDAPTTTANLGRHATEKKQLESPPITPDMAEISTTMTTRKGELDGVIS